MSKARTDGCPRQKTDWGNAKVDWTCTMPAEAALELVKQNEQLKALVLDGLGMQFNKKCSACKNNQREKEVQVERLELILKGK